MHDHRKKRRKTTAHLSSSSLGPPVALTSTHLQLEGKIVDKKNNELRRSSTHLHQQQRLLSEQRNTVLKKRKQLQQLVAVQKMDGKQTTTDVTDFTASNPLLEEIGSDAGKCTSSTGTENKTNKYMHGSLY